MRFFLIYYPVDLKKMFPIYSFFYVRSITNKCTIKISNSDQALYSIHFHVDIHWSIGSGNGWNFTVDIRWDNHSQTPADRNRTFDILQKVRVEAFCLLISRDLSTILGLRLCLHKQNVRFHFSSDLETWKIPGEQQLSLLLVPLVSDASYCKKKARLITCFCSVLLSLPILPYLTPRTIHMRYRSN